MEQALFVFQIVISIALVITILAQNRGTGLSSTFGGNGNSFYSAKRGAEKLLAQITIVLAILFVGNAALYMILF